jgi:hypothetical protein
VIVANNASGEITGAVGNEIRVPPAIQDIADRADRQLAWQFFIYFSLMEYALKQAGYLKEVVAAEPNWDEFSEKHDERFWEALSPGTKLAVDYFEADPPKKQIQVNRKVEWKPSRDKCKTQLTRLLWAIRRVRNNLFHGGKFASEPSRDRKLLEHSIAILNAVLELDPEVSREFRDGLVCQCALGPKR